MLSSFLLRSSFHLSNFENRYTDLHFSNIRLLLHISSIFIEDELLVSMLIWLNPYYYYLFRNFHITPRMDLYVKNKNEAFLEEKWMSVKKT